MSTIFTELADNRLKSFSNEYEYMKGEKESNKNRHLKREREGERAQYMWKLGISISGKTSISNNCSSVRHFKKGG